MMRGFEVIAVVLAAFFLAGIVMGMLLVVVLPLIKNQLKSFHEAVRRIFSRERKYMDGGDWQEPEPPREDEEKPPWYRR